MHDPLAGDAWWKTAETVLQCYQRPDEDRLRKALDEYRGVGRASN